jgi:exopolysaccharide biosynthesis polyprenyl glycosylphosphotransferase
MGVHRVLLIGKNSKIDVIAKIIRRNKNLGYQVVDKIDTAHLKVIKGIKQERGIDEIILCESSITDDEQEKLIDYCAINNVTFKFIPTTLQTSRYEIGILNGEPLIEIKNTPLDGWGKIIKRIFDIVGAAIAIIIFGPIMLVIAVVSWLECGSPVIFRNERIGHKGNFDVLKFRYMKREYCHGAQFSEQHNKKALGYLKKLITEKSIKGGPVYKIKNDPRKTKFGSFLEKFSLDELPQFFNVLMGTMSLVGPRPHQPIEVSKYMDYHRRLLTIKPGVTGMAQVSGRSDIDFEDEYKLDLYYIENWSLWLDIQICLKTIGVLFRKRRN